ncbi:hypothetical protein EAF04_002469 [Stromatinia cepivora]|nr:hypothetical protein EAF04_002469 [Stromatinia cepivora]
MCIRHIHPFPSLYCQSQFIPLQPIHPPKHVIVKEITFCPGYNISNYLSCPRGLEELVWEDWTQESVCADCEVALGEEIGRLSLK